MKTIAQQLKIKHFPFIINDKDGNTIYYEDSKGHWTKREYDCNGKNIYHEDSNGFWYKSEYDSNGNENYMEDSNGVIVDQRPYVVELTLQQIADKFGINVKQLGIKDCLILTI